MNDREVAAAQLDKTHSLLKYVMGTKGVTNVGAHYLCTCTCMEYSLVKTKTAADTWVEDHNDH